MYVFVFRDNIIAKLLIATVVNILPPISRRHLTQTSHVDISRRHLTQTLHHRGRPPRRRADCPPQRQRTPSSASSSPCCCCSPLLPSVPVLLSKPSGPAQNASSLNSVCYVVPSLSRQNDPSCKNSAPKRRRFFPPPRRTAGFHPPCLGSSSHGVTSDVCMYQMNSFSFSCAWTGA